MKRSAITFLLALIVPGNVSAQYSNNFSGVDPQQIQFRQRMQMQQMQQQLYGLQRSQGAIAGQLQNRQDTRNQHGSPEVMVPGETAEQRDARHQAVFKQIDEQAQKQFAAEHPFAPASFGPNIPAEVYNNAAHQSDVEATTEANERIRQEKEAQIQDLQKRIARLEAAATNAAQAQTAQQQNQPMPPPQQAPSQQGLQLQTAPPLDKIVVANISFTQLGLKNGQTISQGKIMNYNKTNGTVVIWADHHMSSIPIALLPEKISEDVRKLSP